MNFWNTFRIDMFEWDDDALVIRAKGDDCDTAYITRDNNIRYLSKIIEKLNMRFDGVITQKMLIERFDNVKYDINKVRRENL